MKILIIVLFSIQNAFALSQIDQLEQERRDAAFKECENNQKMLKLDYVIQCEENYQHYNSRAYKKNYDRDKLTGDSKIKIAEFNVLHPGMGKTKFKDYDRVAKIINKYDVVGVTELIGLTDSDYTNNESVMEFLKTTPDLIKKIKAEIKSLNASIRNSRYSTRVKKRRRALLKKQLAQLESDLPNVKALYRPAGYIRILSALHGLKDGKDWALILSPQGEGSAATKTPELTGYFYKSSKVKPKTNEYCDQSKKDGLIKGNATPFACIVQMNANDMGEDKRDIISRRPFLAEFLSGNFSFTLVTSHVLFEEPNDENLQKLILKKGFGVESHDDLRIHGPGASRDKYARFAEVKLALEFINSYFDKYNKNEDIIFMGDLNLEKENQFWDYILGFWPGSKIYIDEMTSLTSKRYEGKTDEVETKGGSSNYDHFIFDPEQTKECAPNGKVNAGVLNFTQGRDAQYIDRTYKVRTSEFTYFEGHQGDPAKGKYTLDPKKYDRLLERFVEPVLDGDSPILTIGKVTHLHINRGRTYTLKSQGIIVAEDEAKDFANDFEDRIVKSQAFNDSYYYYFSQLVSDHFPIYLECQTN